MTREQLTEFKIGLIKGFTTEQFANACQVSTRTIQRWKSSISVGRSRPRKKLRFR